MKKFHKAVALRYPKDADAPYISASAKGSLAEHLVEIAREHSVPVIENPQMVEVLSVQEVGTVIPESTFEVIAGIFAFIKKVERSADAK